MQHFVVYLMQSKSTNCQSIRDTGCIAFAIAGVAFAFFAFFLSTWGIAWSHGSAEKARIVTKVTLGSIYILGSLISFRKCSSPFWLLVLGMLLNACGACIWVPSIGYLARGGWMVALPGVILTTFWIRLIACNFRKSKE